MANAGAEHERQPVLHRHHRRRTWLDGKHTVFGKVTNGQDVVDKISMVERDARDLPKTPVVLESVELT